MKNVCAMVFLGIAMMTTARADYVCIGEKNDKLSINYSKNQDTYEVLVTYADFDLNQMSTFKGAYDSLSNNYVVLDSQGKNINLKVVKPISHGGRCGRCVDVPVESGPFSKLSYAKITLNDVELSFTCKPQ